MKRIALLLTLPAAVLVACGGAPNQTTSNPTSVQPRPPASKPAGDPVVAPQPTPTDSNLTTVGGTVSYEDGTKVTVTKVARVRFSDSSYGARGVGVAVYVKITAGSATMDLNGALTELTYGADGTEAEQVFDSAKGFDGGFSSTVAPGRSATAKYGFAVPAGQSVVSVQVTPDFSSETAIFEGKIRS